MRKALNLPFEGFDGRGHGVSADVLIHSAPAGAPREWRSTRNLVRSATDDEVRAKVRESFGAEVEISEIRWASRFSDDARLAARYRLDRVLPAGDAAHTHFPADGQGLNLGVQDAMNLGWKLAAELIDRAPAGARLPDFPLGDGHASDLSTTDSVDGRLTD